MTNTRETKKLSLAELLDEVAAAWEMHRDYEIVRDLSETYPRYEEELYAFLDQLVEAELLASPSEEEVEQVQRAVRERLQQHGIELSVRQDKAEQGGEHGAGSASFGGAAGFSEATSFLDYAILESGKTPDEVEKALGSDASFLDDINTYPHVVPLPVGETIIQRAVTKLGLDEETSRFMLTKVDPRRSMAASRDDAYEEETPTFNEIVDRSLMNDEQKAFWKALAHQKP